MPSEKPTLGYPSRTAAIRALRDQNLTTGEIARRIGIPAKTVAAIECGHHRQRQPATVPVDAISLDGATLRALRPHAMRRRISVATLAQRIVEAAVDGMIDALLDDADEIGAVA